MRLIFIVVKSNDPNKLEIKIKQDIKNFYQVSYLSF